MQMLRQHVDTIVAGVVLLGGLLVVFVVVGYVSLNVPEIKQDTTDAARFEQYKRAAQDIKRKTYDYDLVCEEVHPVPGSVCRDSAEAFLIAERIEYGGYYCVDATGYTGTVDRLPSTGFLCQR